MTILDAPPPGWKRPSLTLKAKVEAWENKAGGDVRYDHRPPVERRQFDTETNDTIPPFQDGRFLEPLTRAAHDTRTFGPGGEKRVTTLNSDAHNRKQTRHVRRKEAAHGAVMVAKALGEPAPQPERRKHKIANRPFAKGHRRLQSRNSFKDRRRT